MKGDSVVAAHRGQGHQGLEHPDFVVGRHHAHQLRLGGDRLPQLLRGDQPLGAWGQQGDAETFPLQLLERIEHGVVFGGHADQMAAAPGPGMAQQGQVVGFRGTTGEHQLLRRHRQSIGNLPPRQVHCGRCGQTQPVLTAGGIAPILAPVGRHRLHHLRCTGRGGLVVKVEGTARQLVDSRCCDHAGPRC